MPGLYGFPTLDTYAFMNTKASTSFNFSPFDFEREFGFNFSTKPQRALKPHAQSMKLHEPRPTHPHVFRNALKHFEEIAPFWKDVHNRVTSPAAVESRFTAAKPRPAHPDALAPNDHCNLLSSERAIGAPIRTRSPVFTRPAPIDPLAPAPSVSTSSGLACLSPGFFDRFDRDNTKGRNWARAPSPSSLPPPSFDHFAGQRSRPAVFFRPSSPPQTVAHDTDAANVTRTWHSTHPTNEPSASIPSIIPSIASQYTGDGIEDEETEPLVAEADEDALTYFSEDEVDILEDSLNFVDGDDFEDDDDDDTFYTASECSGYSADSESNWSDDDNEVASDGDDEFSVSSQRAYASTSPSSQDAHASMPDPLVPTYATSPAVSFLSISSTGSSMSTSASLAVPSTPRSPQMPLRWTVGMPGDAVQFLLAAERQTSAEEAQRHKGD
ncbi:hypothetical protein DFH11DRAFT_936742 [Phellopilus nigrolimitatus]|nr:hypothetical protein DFH11DRAFT_936742 [Phellopilus nigrolimitatus]